MTFTLLAALLAVALLALTGLKVLGMRHRQLAAEDGRILFPFRGANLSQSALDATLRLAVSERSTLVPAYLMKVPMTLPLDVALPKQSGVALPILEAIEQRAAKVGVPVDMRLERGRDTRHALGQLIEHEHFQRTVVVSTTAEGGDGFSPDEVAWILKQIPGEVLVVRPKNLTD